MESVMLHCDMDNYYATVEEKYRPLLRAIPFAVCGDPGMRHSIVMSKNALAKKLGIRTGISFYQAKQICPYLGYVKADQQKYLEETKKAREVFKKYSKNIVPYGLDESWIVLNGGTTLKEAQQIADLIRIEIKYSMELSASIGVSYNYIFSKLGSDYKKPDGTTVITKDNYKQIVWPLDASKLLFVGSYRKKVLMDVGIRTIGDIANAKPEQLRKLLGKVGPELWRYANGDDKTFKPNNDNIGSVGNTITTPKDLVNDDDVSAVVYLLVSNICARLIKHSLKARCVSICLRDNQFKKIIRQSSMSTSTDNINRIFNQAYNLFKANYNWEYPLRSVGIRVDKLDTYEQLTLFGNEDSTLAIDINAKLKQLTEKYGTLNVEKSATAKEW